jgi:hypothetical protein
VLWFDFDGDGVIYPWDTFIGFRKLGFNILLSAAAPFVIHGTFSIPTWVGRTAARCNHKGANDACVRPDDVAGCSASRVARVAGVACDHRVCVTRYTSASQGAEP